MGLSSVSTAHHHVNALEEEGYLVRGENTPRAIAVKEINKLIRIPLLGTISAGTPIEAVEEKETIEIPKLQLSKGGKHFALRVKGNSMIGEGIHNGDTVVIKEQTIANNGDTIVALINGNEVTLKKYYKKDNTFVLQPANPDVKPIYTKNLKIQGKVVSVVRNYENNPIVEITEATPESINQTNKEYTLKKWTNTFQCMDCVEGMKQLPDNSIDLVVTSPPYDAIREYNGFSYNLHETGKEIHRILKEGGIAVMVIQDQTKDFGKSLTSFKTIVDWCENIGFKLFETVIYRKHGTEGAWWKYRFRVDHEYMPIFIKGARPAYFNKEPLKVPSKHGGKVMTGSGNRRTDGITTKTVTRPINLTKCRGTVWDYLNAGDKDPLKRKHPAVFPDKIPFDFIQCFCPPDGIVLDPFMGCGSTAIMAKKLKRKYIGFDISKEYCELANQRINSLPETLF